MKRVLVLIPFHLIATNTDHKPGDVIEVSEEQLAKINAVNVNMVEVLGEAAKAAEVESAAEEKPKKKRKPKAE